MKKYMIEFDDPLTKSITWEVNEGLASVSLRFEDIVPLCAFLRNYMKICTNETDVSNFVHIHRASRIAWEAASHNRITNLDMDDISILMQAPSTWQYQWIHKFTNSSGIRSIMRCNVTPNDADGYAKSVNQVMSD